MPLFPQEADVIAAMIDPQFNQVLAQYDFGKYPANSYQAFKNTFSALPPNNNQISDALLWKWGHWGKPNYPQHHKNLIVEVSNLWGIFAASSATTNPQDTFNWWHTKLGRNTTYITTAYITHLVHHHAPLPIIDQHNFRAMNFLKSQVREAYGYKKKPSNWDDIQNLKQFMTELLRALPNRNFGELDRFLMMYGRSHVPR